MILGSSSNVFSLNGEQMWKMGVLLGDAVGEGGIGVN